MHSLAAGRRSADPGGRRPAEAEGRDPVRPAVGADDLAVAVVVATPDAVSTIPLAHRGDGSTEEQVVVPARHGDESPGPVRAAVVAELGPTRAGLGALERLVRENGEVPEGGRGVRRAPLLGALEHTHLDPEEALALHPLLGEGGLDLDDGNTITVFHQDHLAICDEPEVVGGITSFRVDLVVVLPIILHSELVLADFKIAARVTRDAEGEGGEEGVADATHQHCSWPFTCV